ncbi:MAG TPA: S9 family peptidase [Chthoniobacterales bacterium]|nr:S9 family peptidase [Chthoniobacterales bacterium]
MQKVPLRLVRIAAAALVALIGSTPADVLAQKRNITEKDLFDFTWIGDPQISPDGSRVLFVRVNVNDKKDGYKTSIWSVSTAGNEEPRQLTRGERDSSPRWSPDGRSVVFVRGTEKDGKPEPGQLCMLPMGGGDSFVFTDLPKGASNPEWSPDGKTIAFASSSNPEDLTKHEKKKRKEEEQKKAGETAAASPSAAKPDNKPKADEPEERESDIQVITQAVYRRDNEGFLDPKRPPHIWVVPVPASADAEVQPKQLTSGRFEEENFFWAKDGSKIYFASLRVDEPYYQLPRTELYSVGATGGEPVKVNTFEMNTGTLSLSPDGKQIAFVGSTTEPVNSYTQPDLWVVDLTPNAKPRNLTAGLDFDLGRGLTGDNAPPRAGGPSAPIWTADGRGILDVVGREGRNNVTRFDVTTGAATEITRGNQGVLRFRASADGSKIAYTLSTPTMINELFVADASGTQPRQITRINEALFSQLNLTEPEEIWYESFDRKRVHTWVQKPPGFDPKKKYPLILNIHGGPHAAYGYIFSHEFQWMAAKGYVVLYPNPRGSTTYGQEFGNIIQHNYPGDDYKDLVGGVDELVRRGYIDTAKLGVTGGSGGGLLTNWTIGQTDRFAAAVSQRDIADWEAWWYTADFTLFQPTWFKGAPFNEPEDFRKRSPITHINNVKTPLMLILGEADYRTPPSSGGDQMFRALKYRKIPTVMVRFPGESHELSRSGKPWHRIERLQHIVGWFDKWLTGAAKPEYDIAPEPVAAKPTAAQP